MKPIPRFFFCVFCGYAVEIIPLILGAPTWLILLGGFVASSIAVAATA